MVKCSSDCDKPQKEVLSDTINILAQPNFAYLPTAANTAMMYWDPVPGADYYQIYHMGYQHMEKWAITQEYFCRDSNFSWEAPVVFHSSKE